MSAEIFNNKVSELAAIHLIPKGFKKSGVHYFKITDTEYYALIKHTFRGFFEDFFLVYSHEAMADYFTMLKKKPAGVLGDFPISVRVNDLETIYSNSKTLLEAPYYFYSSSRENGIDSKGRESEETRLELFRANLKRDERMNTDEEYIHRYIEDTFDQISKYGFRFFDECNLELCHHSMKRPLEENKLEAYADGYRFFLERIENYMRIKDIPIPSYPNKQSGFFRRLFGKG